MAHSICMQNTDTPRTVPSFLSKSAISSRTPSENKSLHMPLLSTGNSLIHSQEVAKISNLLNANSQNFSFNSDESNNLKRIIELKNSYILKLETENYTLTLENSQLREKLGQLSSLNAEIHCKFLTLQSELALKSETLELLKSALTSLETSHKEEITEIYLQEHSKIAFQSKELDKLHPQIFQLKTQNSSLRKTLIQKETELQTLYSQQPAYSPFF